MAEGVGVPEEDMGYLPTLPLLLMGMCFLFGVMRKFWNRVVVSVAQLPEYTKTP